MSSMLTVCLLVTVLVLPGLDAQGSSRSGSIAGSGSGSGSGSGNLPPPLFPLASVASLTQQQRNNILSIGFTGITAQQFLDFELRDGVFSKAMANIINMAMFGNSRLAKRQQALIRPEDVTVLDSPTVMNGVLTVAFVVGGQGGQGLPISRTLMETILQREGPNLARAMSDATGLTIQFAGVIGANQGAPLSSTAVIGIGIGIALAVVLVAVVITTVVLVCCIKKIQKRKAAKATNGEYVEVREVDENNFSSNWTPLKVETTGDYVAVPDSFKSEGKQDSTNNNTAL